MCTCRRSRGSRPRTVTGLEFTGMYSNLSGLMMLHISLKRSLTYPASRWMLCSIWRIISHFIISSILQHAEFNVALCNSTVMSVVQLCNSQQHLWTEQYRCARSSTEELSHSCVVSVQNDIGTSPTWSPGFFVCLSVVLACRQSAATPHPYICQDQISWLWRFGWCHWKADKPDRCWHHSCAGVSVRIWC